MNTEFRNREEFGFYNSGKYNGCIYGLRKMREARIDGALTADEDKYIETHLLHCRRCRNSWDALDSEDGDSWPREDKPLDAED